MAYTIKYHYTSNTGKCRRVNQDNFLCVGRYLEHSNNGSEKIETGIAYSSEAPNFAVFDGMGGEERGEMAAYISAKELSEFEFGKDVKNDLIAFCKKANFEICRFTEEKGLTSMGTTAAVLKFTKSKIYLCNIGDSKIFYLSDGVLSQLSYDHIGLAAFGRKPPLSQRVEKSFRSTVNTQVFFSALQGAEQMRYAKSG